MTRQNLAHRKVMAKELKKQICQCCGHVFFNLEIHHIDGNYENDKKDNLIAVCGRCHREIHQDYNFSEERKKINELRIKLLRNKKEFRNLPVSEIMNYLKYHELLEADEYKDFIKEFKKIKHHIKSY